MGSAGDAGVMCDKHAPSCAVEDVLMIMFNFMLHPLLFLFLFHRALIFGDLSMCACGCVMFDFCCGGYVFFIACVFAQEHAQICYLNNF